MLEQQRCSDCVINMANTAISVASEDDPDLATLHSIVFCHHLKLGHHQEAYHSLIANPDAARRKDCLRQLVVTLFDRKRLDILADFPYQVTFYLVNKLIIHSSPIQMPPFARIACASWLLCCLTKSAWIFLLTSLTR